MAEESLSGQLAGQLAELQRQCEELRASELRKDKSLSKFVHDVRNPLSTLVNALQILRMAGEIPPAAAGVYDIMDRQVAEVLRLVRELRPDCGVTTPQVAHPAAEKTEDAAAASPTCPDGEASCTTAGRASIQSRCRILIVDDMRASAYMSGRLLESLGHEVKLAESAASALEIVEQAPFDLVIADIAMPDIDGYELARRLRGNPRLRHLVLAASTGYCDASDRDQAMAAGFDFYLVKPVDQHRLKELLENVTRLKSGEITRDSVMAMLVAAR